MNLHSRRGKYTSPEGSYIVEYVVTFSCFVLIFGIGCVVGFISPALSILTAPDSPFTITAIDTSNLGAVIGIGHMIAPSLIGHLIDVLGRRGSLLGTAVILTISWGFTAIASHAIVLLIARVFGGLSIVLGITLVPLYLGEIASPRSRGVIGTVTGSALNCGILFAYAVLPYMKLQMFSILLLGISIASTIGIYFIPESPYFLAMKCKFESAEETLEKFKGKNDVTEELELIKESVKIQCEELKKHADWKADGKNGTKPKKFNAFKQMFRVRGYRRALLINVMFSVTLQAGGYTSLFTYGSTIFTAMKVGPGEYIASIISAVIQLSFNILTSFFINKLGRRPLICFAGVLGGLCTLGISVYFYVIEHTNIDVSAYSNVALLTVFLYIATVNFGTIPLQLVTVSETIAPEVKAMMNMIVGIVAGLSATITAKLYILTAVSWSLGHCVPFLGFTLTTWVCTAVIMKNLPETKGKTLLEIQSDLNA